MFARNTLLLKAARHCNINTLVIEVRNSVSSHQLSIPLQACVNMRCCVCTVCTYCCMQLLTTIMITVAAAISFAATP
jgi:hypothetical protein